MVNLLLKVAVILLSIDILIVATSWYMAATLSFYFPAWWRRTIVDTYPE